MTTLLHLPPGWLATALATSSIPCFQAEPLSSLGPMSPIGDSLDPNADVQRLREIERGGAPRILTPAASYRVVDIEQMENEILYYTRQMGNGGETGRWRLFFQEGIEDPHPQGLGAEDVREYLLKVYTDENIYVVPNEITYPKPELKSSRAREDGATVHDVSLQNGRVLPVVYGEGYGRPSIKGLMNFLALVPLSALTQIDEIRMVPEQNASGGHTFREGKKLVNVFYPLMGAASGGDTDKEEFIRFLYTMFHESFGHGFMYYNRFLRREMIKIVAAGEEAPSDYARTSIEEWFPEGVAERGCRVFMDDPEIAAWDRRHVYLSGLIRHLLGVMEETVEPVNENIALWRDTLRPIDV